MAARRAASAAQKGKGGTKGAGATKRRSAPQKPRGRPSEFTAEVEKAILDALAAGASVSSACEAAGVGRTTYYRCLAVDGRRLRDERLDDLVRHESEPAREPLPGQDEGCSPRPRGRSLRAVSRSRRCESRSG